MPQSGQILNKPTNVRGHQMRLSRPSKVSTRYGVTIVEIMAVIAIISTMSVLSFYAFSSAKKFADGIATSANNATGKIGGKAGNKTTTTLPTINIPKRPDYINGEYFITFTSGVTNHLFEAGRLASLVGGRVGSVYVSPVSGFILYTRGSSSPALMMDPAVKLIEPVPAVYPCAVPTNIKRMYSNGLGLMQDTPATNTTYGAPLNVYRFYKSSATGTGVPLVGSRVPLFGSTGATVGVGIMDTGIDNTHPDLFVVFERDFTKTAGVLNNNPTDQDGHGTHVAGVVGANDQSAGTGVVGMYPGAPLINLKVINGASRKGAFGGTEDEFPGSASAVYDALTFVASAAGSMRVCLMAFETTSNDPKMNALINAASNAGVLMVAAAGNGQYAAGGFAPITAGNRSPAAATESIVVGAIIDEDGLPGGLGTMTEDDMMAPYSNTAGFGRPIDFAAPGGYPDGSSPTPSLYQTVYTGLTATYQIRSTTPVASGVLYSAFVNDDQGDGVTIGSDRPAFGTSFAAAHVAGLLAMVLDPQTTIGYVIGTGTVPTFRFGVKDRTTALNNIRNLTSNTTRFQMVNPLSVPPSAWTVSAGIPKIVTPYTKVLNRDRITSQVGIPGVLNVIVPNLYQNPGVAPSFLPAFPG